MLKHLSAACRPGPLVLTATIAAAIAIVRGSPDANTANPTATGPTATQVEGDGAQLAESGRTPRWGGRAMASAQAAATDAPGGQRSPAHSRRRPKHPGSRAKPSGALGDLRSCAARATPVDRAGGQTRNKPFSAWGQIFGDDMAATAMIDRLIHHAEILSLKGDSSRLRGKDPRGPLRPPRRLTLQPTKQQPDPNSGDASAAFAALAYGSLREKPPQPTLKWPTFDRRGPTHS